MGAFTGPAKSPPGTVLLQAGIVWLYWTPDLGRSKESVEQKAAFWWGVYLYCVVDRLLYGPLCVCVLRTANLLSSTTYQNRPWPSSPGTIQASSYSI